MPNFDSDDTGCLRDSGDGWGPNPCKCAACEEDRRRQARLQAESDAEYRSMGLDSNATVIPLMVGLDETSYFRLLKLASRRGIEPHLFVAIILKELLQRSVNSGVIHD